MAEILSEPHKGIGVNAMVWQPNFLGRGRHDVDNFSARLRMARTAKGRE